MVRAASQWVIAFLLVLSLTAFFLALVGFQVTAEETGQRVHRRAVAVATDIDAVLPQIEVSLHRAAQEGAGDSVRVPDFPIPVDLPRAEARTLEGAALRDRLLAEAARRLYDDGMSAWAAGDPDARQDVERISSAGAVRTGLGLVTDSTHTAFLVATILLGLLSLALAVLLLAAVRWYFRLIALGAVTLAAALPSLAAAVGLRFAFRTGQPEADTFVTDLLALGIDTTWVAIRDYLTLTVLGLLITGTAGAVLWWQSHEGPPAPEPYTDGAL